MDVTKLRTQHKKPTNCQGARFSFLFFILAGLADFNQGWQVFGEASPVVWLKFQRVSYPVRAHGNRSILSAR